MRASLVGDPAERVSARILAEGTAQNATLLLLGLALARLIIQFSGITHYGFFRDELYYMACGEHLAWGYVDQPPLVAFVAWLARHAFGDSIVSIRLFPVLSGVAIVFFTGLFARELGGGRFAQFLAATAMLFAPLFLAFHSFLSMNAFEPLFWLSCSWIAVRVVQGASPRLWLVFGAVAGIGLENKHTTLVFGFALIAGLLLSGKYRLFGSKWIWIGGLVALALFLPNLIWEARNGWPQIEVVRNAQLYKNVHIGPLRFLGDQVLFLHPIALPIWVGGLIWLFTAREGKRYRYLGWTYVITVAIFVIFGGKSYYPLPAYPMLLAAGGVAFESFVEVRERRWLKVAFPALLVVGGLVTVPFGVPLLPVETFLRYTQGIPIDRMAKTERGPTVALPQLYADMFGWENMAAAIGRVYQSVPESEQAECAILAGNYGEAGAIDYYGRKLGLPRAISGHNSYFYWGPRNYTGGCVILFGERADEFKNFFGDVRRVATISDPHAMLIEQGISVYLCRKPCAPLNVLWPRFKLII